MASIKLSLFRLVQTVPCMAAFMSSLSLISLALDRHRAIMKPHMSQVSAFHRISHIALWGEVSEETCNT